MQKPVKAPCVQRNIYIWNPNTCTCENVKYLESIIGDSVITCNEIMKVMKTISTKTTSSKTIPTNFNEKKVPEK